MTFAKNRPPIYFFLPESEESTNIPASSREYWKWLCNLNASPRGNDIHAWITQTYIMLKENNYPCELINQMPNNGIVVALRKTVPRDLKPNKNLFLMCVLSDARQPVQYQWPPYGNAGLLPFANIHLVQNPLENKAVSNSFYLPFWLQADLIPRDPNRGQTFENIVFFGWTAQNGTSKRQEMSKSIQELGVKYIIQDEHNHDKWNDYSCADAVVAIRGFGSDRYNYKPANKLFNAWRAGVPAVLGCESAYRFYRKSDLDYIEAKSFKDVIKAILLLQNNPKLRKAMIDNGLRRATELSNDIIVNLWIEFLEKKAVPAYFAWINKAEIGRSAYYFKRYPYFFYLKLVEYYYKGIRSLKKIIKSVLKLK